METIGLSLLKEKNSVKGNCRPILSWVQIKQAVQNNFNPKGLKIMYISIGSKIYLVFSIENYGTQHEFKNVEVFHTYENAIKYVTSTLELEKTNTVIVDEKPMFFWSEKNSKRIAKIEIRNLK